MKIGTLRRINRWISLILVLLLVFHMVTGAGIMFGRITGGFTILHGLTHVMVALLAVHIVIGILLLFETGKVRIRTGEGYAGQNRLFWIRRGSAFAVILFLTLHLMLFVTIGGFVLRPFRIFQLICNIGLIISLAVHVLTNLKPLFIAFGFDTRGKKGKILCIVFMILCLAAAAAFGYYFVRWNVFREFGG